MTWFRIDDTLHGHPKARAAGLPALGLWVVSGSWSSQQLTDGEVPEWFVRSWSANRLTSRLVEAGLWEPTDEGWRFHEWHEANPSREQVLTERASNAERQRRWRNGSRNGVTHAERAAAPALPDP